MKEWLKLAIFETRIGEWLLALFEHLTGLALVDLEMLQDGRIQEVD